MIKKVLLAIGVIVLIAGFIGGVVYLSNRYLNNASPKSDVVVSCDGITGASHQVVIENDKVIPEVTNGKLCDTMTITNKDDKSRDIAFGQHVNHVAYDGITEETLTKDKSLTVTFNKSGDYIFHDHDQDEVNGSFVVVNK